MVNIMNKRLLILFFSLCAINLSVFAAPNLTAEDITSGVDIIPRQGHQISHELQFTDSNGKTVLLSEYFQNERPTVISMVYYSCPLLCSMLTDGKIDVINNQIGKVIGEDFNVVSISFDPEDSIETSSAFREKHLPRISVEGKENWAFLTGTKDMIDALLDDIGYKVMFIPTQGEYAHPSGLVIIRPDGKVSRYLNGMQFPPFDLKMSLIEAKTQEKISLLERGLLFCYSFDPDANSYTIEVLNLMKVAGIMTVIILALWIRFFIRRENRKNRK